MNNDDAESDGPRPLVGTAARGSGAAFETPGVSEHDPNPKESSGASSAAFHVSGIAGLPRRGSGSSGETLFSVNVTQAPTVAQALLQTTIALTSVNQFDRSEYVASFASASRVRHSQVEVVAVQFKVKSAYNFPGGTSFDLVQAAEAIAAQHSVSTKSVAVTITRVAGHWRPGERHHSRLLLEAEISTSDHQVAEAATKSSKNLIALSSILTEVTGSKVEKPKSVAEPTLSVLVDTLIKAPGAGAAMPTIPEASTVASALRAIIRQDISLAIEPITDASLTPTPLPQSPTAPPTVDGPDFKIFKKGNMGMHCPSRFLSLADRINGSATSTDSEGKARIRVQSYQSGVRGVWWNKTRNWWQVAWRKDRKIYQQVFPVRKYCTSDTTEDDARSAALEAAIACRRKHVPQERPPSKTRGVTWDKNGGAWRVRLRCKGKTFCYGSIRPTDNTAEAREAARLRAVKVRHEVEKEKFQVMLSDPQG